MDLKQLCEINAVSGNEQQIRRLLLKEAESINGVAARIDRVGNVVCEKKCGQPGKKHILVTAPMDEPGFMVLSATKDGFLRISPVGKLDGRMVISKRITIGGDKLNAVIGAKPIHLQTADDRKRALSWDEIYADVGAKSDEEALAAAPKGSYCAFDTPFVTFGNGYVSCKALSSRGCVYNLLRLLHSDLDADITAVFTTLRLSQHRGAAVVPYSIQPDYAVVLSSCLCNDLGDSEDVCHVSEMCGGVSITFMDKGAISSRNLFRSACEIAEEKSIAHQVQRGLSPAGDAGAIQCTSAPNAVITLSIPCRNMNTPSEVMNMSDIDSQLSMTIEMINNL